MRIPVRRHIRCANRGPCGAEAGTDSLKLPGWMSECIGRSARTDLSRPTASPDWSWTTSVPGRSRSCRAAPARALRGSACRRAPRGGRSADRRGARESARHLAHRSRNSGTRRAEGHPFSRSDLVFPAGDGKMLSEDINTERVLRSALARAGLVMGYDHTCRRCKAKRMSHVERHPDAKSPALPSLQHEALATPAEVEDALPRSSPHRRDAHAAGRSGSASRTARFATRFGDDDDRHLCAPRDRGPARGGEQDRSAGLGTLAVCGQVADVAPERVRPQREHAPKSA